MFLISHNTLKINLLTNFTISLAYYNVSSKKASPCPIHVMCPVPVTGA